MSWGFHEIFFNERLIVASLPDANESCTARYRWRISGQVQGVGFRPFVYRLACSLGLSGFIHNDSHGVTLEAQGAVERLERFTTELMDQRPPLAVIARVRRREIGTHDNEDRFRILASATDAVLRAQVTVDTSVCMDCLDELSKPTDRRFGYGLINCTNCGPRYSILHRVPYDRANTTMAGFEMCDACRSEYTHSADRRFHAQPIACHDCGPKVELVDVCGRRINGNPVRRAAVLLEQGKIVAIKGLGGFHLAVRADDEQAVMRLRQLKQRNAKPFAVMCATVSEARRQVRLTRRAVESLLSPAAPIVLAERRQGSSVVPAVASQNHRLGVMLPSTPIHHLLFASEVLEHVPLVMTSGNLSDEPLAIDNQEAIDRLSTVCDAILWHDRPIERCVDDSLWLDMGDDDPLPLRRARGYVPGALPLSSAYQTQGLCVGGELKNTVAVVRDGQVILSQHLGDLKHPLSLAHFKKTIDDLTDLFGIQPEWIAHDLHPAYLSAAYAKDLAQRWGVPLIGVQHHHAHAAAVLAEHDRHGPALAVVCDGVGYGDDGTAWGGELLLVDLISFKRLAHLRPLLLPGAGGDAAAKETRRCGLALLHQALGDDFNLHPAAERLLADPTERRMLTQMICRGFNCVSTSSTGRVFDGVASLLGLCHENRFEAQAAIALEAAAAKADGLDQSITDSLFVIRDDEANKDIRQIDLSAFVKYLLEINVTAGSAPQLAAMFHEVLAAAWEAAVIEASQQSRITTIVLSGGVFCNQRLTQRLSERLRRRGLDVLRHRLVPPNDGGVSYGQAAVASSRVAQRSPSSSRTGQTSSDTVDNHSCEQIAKEHCTCA